MKCKNKINFLETLRKNIIYKKLNDYERKTSNKRNQDAFRNRSET